ncbi:hypothetical protein HII36_42715 [Nonomuraea sp. NN258]|uniref:hypothetical protein n=1 Tax=Nonomuraea antri TaxID=2730852 RepID=UPI001569828A|nr:hypothetical protein [Nonomuraea antri]NRQ38495.1 hypothetical protein [Nonomuraea antri]
MDEELILDRENVNVEARGNLMAFGFAPEDFDAELVEQALIVVGERLRARFADVAGPVTFYAWYDEQTGQLRCSAASVEPSDLPFGGRFRPADSPAPVLALMTADALPGVVPWTDLREVAAEEDAGPDEQVEHTFPVFAVKLTR